MDVACALADAERRGLRRLAAVGGTGRHGEPRERSDLRKRGRRDGQRPCQRDLPLRPRRRAERLLLRAELVEGSPRRNRRRTDLGRRLPRLRPLLVRRRTLCLRRRSDHRRPRRLLRKALLRRRRRRTRRLGLRRRRIVVLAASVGVAPGALRPGILPHRQPRRRRHLHRPRTPDDGLLPRRRQRQTLEDERPFPADVILQTLRRVAALVDTRRTRRLRPRRPQGRLRQSLGLQGQDDLLHLGGAFLFFFFFRTEDHPHRRLRREKSLVVGAGDVLPRLPCRRLPCRRRRRRLGRRRGRPSALVKEAGWLRRHPHYYFTLLRGRWDSQQQSDVAIIIIPSTTQVIGGSPCPTANNVLTKALCNQVQVLLYKQRRGKSSKEMGLPSLFSPRS
mmetsp:Transcript_35702/g.114216  ORF Transcript_35702/g.114216 Transcript_35702/m.114216 type:complete len:391 (-) Transcript_35702:1013-2185(-)